MSQTHSSSDLSKTDLPPNVSHAYGDIYCFTPSLVAVVFEFAFDEKHSRILDDALRQERESYVTPISTGYRIHDPGNQRISHIEKIRKDTKRLITEWFSENIPGVFSDGLLGGDFPTCEFVTLRKAQPFPAVDEHVGRLSTVLAATLDFPTAMARGRVHEMPALRFSPHASYRGDPTPPLNACN